MINNEVVEVIGGNRTTNVIVYLNPYSKGGTLNINTTSYQHVSLKEKIVFDLLTPYSFSINILGDIKILEITTNDKNNILINNNPIIYAKLDNSSNLQIKTINITILNGNQVYTITENDISYINNELISFTFDIPIQYNYINEGSIGRFTITSIEYYDYNKNIYSQEVNVSSKPFVYLKKGEIIHLTTAQDIVDMSTYTLSKTDFNQMSIFSLDNDIDLTGYQIEPFLFIGAFIGNGHTIKNYSYVNEKNNKEEVSFFTSVRGIVQDLNFENAYISIRSNVKTNIGILSARTNEFASFDNINIQGTIRLNTDYFSYIGGMIARASQERPSYGKIFMNNCHIDVLIDHKGSYYNCIGGLVGYSCILDISNSTTKGEIKTYLTVLNEQFEAMTIGGMIGLGSRLNMNRCKSNISITLTDDIQGGHDVNVAGICGTADNSILDIIEYSGTIDVLNKYNNCDISGIMGYTYGVSLTNAYFNGILTYKSLTHNVGRVSGIAGFKTGPGNLDHNVSDGVINFDGTDMSIIRDQDTFLCGLYAAINDVTSIFNNVSNIRVNIENYASGYRSIIPTFNMWTTKIPRSSCYYTSVATYINNGDGGDLYGIPLNEHDRDIDFYINVLGFDPDIWDLDIMKIGSVYTPRLKWEE